MFHFKFKCLAPTVNDNENGVIWQMRIAKELESLLRSKAINCAYSILTLIYHFICIIQGTLDGAYLEISIIYLWKNSSKNKFKRGAGRGFQANI